MKAAVNIVYGIPEVVHITTMAPPSPKPNEVLIKVHCTTVNRTDCGFRNPVPWWVRFFSGIIRPRRVILGNEFSGVVEHVGTNVSKFKKGDAVFGLTGMRFGAHAEFLCLPQSGPFALKPANMSFQQAAAVCDGMMMGIACMRRLNVNATTRILIYGASGSIGTACVQFAKYYNAHVTAVCSTKDVEVVRGLGADVVIDYLKEDFTQRSERFDVVLDAVGKHSCFKCRNVLTSKGVYASTDLGNWYQNPWLTLLTAFSNGRRVLFPLPKESAADIEFFKQVIESGRYQAVIDRVYSLEEIVDAYRYVETEQKTGNVVCTVATTDTD
jgi:NADPH:quinone reductase-like Zn-dependent oxidoreductase